MKKLLFIQVSSRLINSQYTDTKADRYYESIYRLKDGYNKGDHFWEIPLWVAEIDGFLKDEMYTYFGVIEKDKTLDLNEDYDYILFSVMDVNKQYIQKFISNYRGQAEILTGGYTQIEGLKYFRSPRDLAEYLNVPYKYALNYQHFKDVLTIPRITLSTGCRHKCKFCTTQHFLTEKSPSEILYQAEQISESLQFKYVYVADSTFGQAENHTFLMNAYSVIKRNNPFFEGFIVQTTASQLSKPGFIESLPDLGVRIVEIGMESFNNRILRALNKPARERLIRYAVTALKAQGIECILNVIIGLPTEGMASYSRTLEYIEESKGDLFALNIYNLALYEESTLGKEIGINTPEDSNELSSDKSFGNKKHAQYFYDHIFDLGMDILGKHEYEPLKI